MINNTEQVYQMEEIIGGRLLANSIVTALLTERIAYSIAPLDPPQFFSITVSSHDRARLHAVIKTCHLAVGGSVREAFR